MRAIAAMGVTNRPRVLLFGGTGQIGSELARLLPAMSEVFAPTRAEADFTNVVAVRHLVRELRPDIVVNAAGYSFVDAAECERALCDQLNVVLPRLLAVECNRLGGLLVHFSTDYVFDGAKRSPYLETDEPRPLGVYSRTKHDGERAVIDAGGAFLIFRTSWIHAPRGRNFPSTIMRLARERADLPVVDDQVGSPTSASAVAIGVRDVLATIGQAPDRHAFAVSAAGVYHMTASGSTTWYEFAQRILADDPRADEHSCHAIRPISSAEYPTAAKRPAYSVLDNRKLAEQFGVRLPSWLEQWRATLAELRPESQPAFAEGIATHRADRLTV